MNKKDKLLECTLKILEANSRKSIANYKDDERTTVNSIITEIKEVLGKYADNISVESKKVNTVIDCDFKTIERPDKNGNYNGIYYEIPFKDFENFINDLKNLGYRQYGELVWNDFLIMFNNRSLTGYVTLVKKFDSFRVNVKIKVHSIESGSASIIISVK